MGYFAYFSPFNPFRINRMSSELSKIGAQLRPIYAPQPVWNQHAIESFAVGTLSLLNSLIPLLLFHFFPSRSLASAHFLQFNVYFARPLCTAHRPPFTVHGSPYLGYLAASDIFGTQRFWARTQSESGKARNLRRAHRTCPRRRNSKQRGTL